MRGANFCRQVEGALTSEAEIPASSYLRWAVDGDLPSQARAYQLSAQAWHRIQPEPSMEEQCSFMANYLLTCLELDPQPDAWMHSGFQAGHELAAWLKHLARKHSAASVIASVATSLENLYRMADAPGRKR